MKKALFRTMKVLAGFSTVLFLAFAYLHFGPRKMHFSISGQQVHFDRTAISSGAGDVTFHTLDGSPEHLAAYRGQVVILHRWGTWCAPCVAEMPAFEKLYEQYRNDPQVRFIAVASSNTPSDVRTFASRYHYNLPFYVADDKDDARTSLAMFPMTMFYARDGSLSDTKAGSTDWGDPAIKAQIERLKHS